MKLRHSMLRAARPVTLLMDKIRVRVGKAPLSGREYVDMMRLLQTGDIVLTRTKWRPTNLFIPGYWSHALIVTEAGDGEVVEAVLPAVRSSYMIDVWTSASDVKVLRPHAIAQVRAQAAQQAIQLIGTPYDTGFSPSLDALYCSELVMLALTRAGVHIPRLGHDVAGSIVVYPQDLDTDRYFDTIWSK